MKTKHLLFSLIAIVSMTVVLGGIYPPAPEAHAEATVSKAPQAKQKPKTNNVSSKTKQTKTTTKKQATQPKLSQHERWMKAAGIPKSDWKYVEDVVNNESGWCATKWEGEIGYCPDFHGVPYYGGYGMCQSTPARKMASAGSDWKTNPVTQLKWCYAYGNNYGSWAEAKKFRDCLGKCYSTRTHNYQYKKTTWF